MSAFPLPIENWPVERVEKLPTQQKAVLMHIANGLSIKEIAFHIQRSPKTVEYHYATLKAKLGMQHTALLTRLAIRAGLVTL